MPYVQDIGFVTSDAIGQLGLSLQDISATATGLLPAVEWLRRQHDTGMPMLTLPAKQDDIAAIYALARQINERFSTLVVLGTGGSSLGGKTLAALKQNALGGYSGAQLVFVDNVDPDSMDGLFALLDPKRTAFLAISKSGGTAETMVQVHAARDWLIKAAVNVGEHCFIITMPSDSPLRRLAQRDGMQIIDHDPALGGRFSIFSEVGLLPAAVAGLDIEALRAGAAEMLTTVLADGYASAVPVVGAAVQWLLLQKGCTVSVLMPYSDRLACFAHWYRQVWAESLGKDGKGTTPVPALGTVDQHSQLQLYLAGPRDKLITVITCEQAGKGARIHSDDADLAYLTNQTVGDVMAAEQHATIETLVHNGRPVRHLHMAQLGERQLGALLMHFMLETVLMAHLLGINAYDQPAVEEGKELARVQLLGQKL